MNKEIEKMARIVCISCFAHSQTCNDKVCEASIKYATDLYNAGYGKVKDYKKEIERLNKQNKALMQGQIDCVNEGQKEIKEFAVKLKKKCWTMTRAEDNEKIKIIPIKDIDDLLKEYKIGE